jgi:hypothetical protein
VRLDYNLFFLLKKQAFNGLLKVIGIQLIFYLKVFGRYEDMNEGNN